MRNLNAYRKAIVAAVGGMAAVIYAIARGSSPDEIQVIAEAFIGVLTTILVYAIPNDPT